MSILENKEIIEGLKESVIRYGIIEFHFTFPGNNKVIILSKEL